MAPMLILTTTKILTYLSSGLNVIASSTKAIEQNKVNGLVNVVNNYNLQSHNQLAEFSLYTKQEVLEKLLSYEVKVLFDIRSLLND